MLWPVRIDAVKHRVEPLTTYVLALEVVQAASITLDLGWLLPRLLLELLDDLASPLIEWN